MCPHPPPVVPYCTVPESSVADCGSVSYRVSFRLGTGTRWLVYCGLIVGCPSGTAGPFISFLFVAGAVWVGLFWALEWPLWFVAVALYKVFCARGCAISGGQPRQFRIELPFVFVLELPPSLRLRAFSLLLWFLSLLFHALTFVSIASWTLRAVYFVMMCCMSLRWDMFSPKDTGTSSSRCGCLHWSQTRWGGRWVPCHTSSFCRYIALSAGLSFFLSISFRS